jgi:F-box/WD-40 domain protein MET30
MSSNSQPYVCDTIPAPRFQPIAPSAPTSDPPLRVDSDKEMTPDPNSDRPPTPPPQPSSRKLCVRHQRMADEGTNLKLQQVRSQWNLNTVS